MATHAACCALACRGMPMEAAAQCAATVLDKATVAKAAEEGRKMKKKKKKKTNKKHKEQKAPQSGGAAPSISVGQRGDPFAIG